MHVKNTLDPDIRVMRTNNKERDRLNRKKTDARNAERCYFVGCACMYDPDCVI